MTTEQNSDKPVVMTCCDSRYSTVAETIGHECPTKITVGSLVRKSPTGSALWTVAEIKTSTYCGTQTVEARVRKITTSHGGYWYPITDLYPA